MSTLGYGNITPINGYEIFLTIAQTLIGLFFLVVILEYLDSISQAQYLQNLGYIPVEVSINSSCLSETIC